jgi:hypothetical protein
MPVQNMPDIADFSSSNVTLPTHTDPVNIFLNTRAIDVPVKLNSLATAFRDFNVLVRDAWKTYIDGESVSIANYLNGSVQSMVDFINNSMVAFQNQFITDAENAVTTLENSVDDFKQELLDEVGGYVNATAYSIENSNKFEFSGETSDDTYDSHGRILSAKQGVKSITNIVYGPRSRIVSYTETLLIGSISYTKNYTVTYERGHIPQVTEV